MTSSVVNDVGVTDARQLMRRLMVPDPPPFALLYRNGPGGRAVELMTGEISHASLLADLPLPRPSSPGRGGPDVLAVVPFRQVVERGYACHDDGAPILALAVGDHAVLPVREALDLLPDTEVVVSECGFDPSDEEYATIVRRIIDGEIRTGEGSNFVIRRSFAAALSRYRPRVAMTIFRRLLASECNAYWTFLVHTGDSTFIGASPEQHVQVAGGVARMNPISGTLRYPPAGPRLRDVLDFLGDQKEIDELYMVVDEELKMLARVCDEGARVRGPYLREMASLAHTEYVLEGATGMDVRDVLRETLFAPTVIGSPLENACRVIVRHETTGRGYYGGALALFGRDASGQSTMDSAILIRTAEVRGDGTLRIDVGATLVRDSRPGAEVAETWAKVDALLAATGVGGAVDGMDGAAGGLDGVGAVGSAGARERGPGASTRAAGGRMAEHPRVRSALRGRNAGLSSFWLAAGTSGPTGAVPAGAVPAGAVPAGAVPAGAVPGGGRTLDALIVDAEDLFTGMLGHQLRCLGHRVTIRPVSKVEPSHVDDFDVVVLGPGPGDPDAVDDERVARLRELIRCMLAARVPFVAECLSHQVLCSVLGLRLFRRYRPNQGTQQRIDLFGRPELVGFYNSYAARHGGDRVPVAGGAAWADLCRDPRTGEVHATRGGRFASVQFHLESVLTQRGAGLLAEMVAWAMRNGDAP